MKILKRMAEQKLRALRPERCFCFLFATWYSKKNAMSSSVNTQCPFGSYPFFTRLPTSPPSRHFRPRHFSNTKILLGAQKTRLKMKCLESRKTLHVGHFSKSIEHDQRPGVHKGWVQSVEDIRGPNHFSFAEPNSKHVSSPES